MKHFTIKPRTEHQTQNALLDYLNYHGIKAWRQNAGMIAISDPKAPRGKRIIRRARVVRLIYAVYADRAVKRR